MKYFKKENARNPVFGANKQAIRFEQIGGDTGVIALDELKPEDAPNLAVLDGLADKRVGGVVRISAEIYDSLKKNAASTPSPQRSSSSPLNGIRTSPSPGSFGLGLPAVSRAAVANQPQGIRVMDEPEPPSSIAQFRARSRPLTTTPPAPPV